MVVVDTSPRPQSSMLSVTETAGRRLEHLCKSFTKVSDAVGKLTKTAYLLSTVSLYQIPRTCLPSTIAERWSS